MKKNNITYILLMLSGYVFMYLIISFVKMQYNPVVWDNEEREILIVIGTICSAFIIIIKMVIKSDTHK